MAIRNWFGGSESSSSQNEPTKVIKNITPPPPPPPPVRPTPPSPVVAQPVVAPPQPVVAQPVVAPPQPVVAQPVVAPPPPVVAQPEPVKAASFFSAPAHSWNSDVTQPLKPFMVPSPEPPARVEPPKVEYIAPAIVEEKKPVQVVVPPVLAPPQMEVTPNRKNASKIGPTVLVQGDIEIAEDQDLIIEGKVFGNIFVQGDVILEKSAHLEADIKAKNLWIHGYLQGNVFVDDKVQIEPTGTMVGELIALRLAVADGARFKGHIHMGPEMMAAPPVAAPETSPVLEDAPQPETEVQDVQDYSASFETADQQPQEPVSQAQEFIYQEPSDPAGSAAWTEEDVSSYSSESAQQTEQSHEPKHSLSSSEEINEHYLADVAPDDVPSEPESNLETKNTQRDDDINWS